MKTLIKNIKELVQVEDQIREKVCGKDMANLQTIKDAFLLIEDDKILDFGQMSSLKEEKADIIYRFLILGFSMGAKIVNHLVNDTVMSLFEMNRNVSNEANHCLGFLRFKEINNHILLAKINPKNDIIRLVAPHFSDRLSNENFIIYDENRKSCVVHKAGYPWIYTIGDNLNLDNILSFSNAEEEFQSLWKIFFETIGIEERKNDKLQRNNLPLRHRNNMPEFNKSEM